jgi:hypothetical protein
MSKKLFDNLKVSRADGEVNNLGHVMFVIPNRLQLLVKSVLIGKREFKEGDSLDR